MFGRAKGQELSLFCKTAVRRPPRACRCRCGKSGVQAPSGTKFAVRLLMDAVSPSKHQKRQLRRRFAANRSTLRSKRLFSIQGFLSGCCGSNPRSKGKHNALRECLPGHGTTDVRPPAQAGAAPCKKAPGVCFQGFPDLLLRKVNRIHPAVSR